MPAEDPRPDFVPDWPTCERDPGCRGIPAGDGRYCLAHLDPDERDRFIEGLRPGADLDLSGTVISNELFVRLLYACRDYETHRFRFGTVRFNRAWFQGRTWFDSADFAGDADFAGAWFGGPVRITSTSFAGTLTLGSAQFRAGADFTETHALRLVLTWARFAGVAKVRFDGAIDCMGARFEDGLVLASSARVDANGAIFGAVSSIDSAELLSLANCDVGNLVLTDTDLRWCRFAGAHRLDQLRIDGRSGFGTPPRGRWTRRRVLAEEQEWRGWSEEARSFAVGPARIGGTYRALRKSFEDSKNEAGAGDFYYGEMEMRRHSGDTPRAERWILWVYWLLSGYGQRAARAVAALLVVIATVGVLLAVWGQPPAEAAQIAVGAVVLRDTRAELTEAGQWAVMAARVLGPVLLALAVLAVRARVKR
ncbi:pentapeptide repeat-containing protein [Actinophytocola sp.]|uniref:pentapeptide repeat-containing protein n=1 Tax=Actinophytocola sp. TaxID=1872138 RepID=UPI003D6A90ED